MYWLNILFELFGLVWFVVTVITAECDFSVIVWAVRASIDRGGWSLSSDIFTVGGTKVVGAVSALELAATPCLVWTVIGTTFFALGFGLHPLSKSDWLEWLIAQTLCWGFGLFALRMLLALRQVRSLRKLV